MLSVANTSATIMSADILCVVMLDVDLLCASMLNAIMLSVVILTVTILTVIAPSKPAIFNETFDIQKSLIFRHKNLSGLSGNILHKTFLQL
jgi:hypothetical protein